MPLRVQYLDLCIVLNGMVNGYVIALGKFMRWNVKNVCNTVVYL